MTRRSRRRLHRAMRLLSVATLIGANVLWLYTTWESFERGRA